MREVASNLSLRSVPTIAVLAAINLADELRKESESNERIDQAAGASADRLSALIDLGVASA
jgi:cell division protein ZapA (FtsZ GTPase activity inhibitor)